MILKLLFYLPGVLAILWEGMNITSPLETNQFVKRYRQITREKKGEDRTRAQNIFGALQLFYWVWCMVGLFSSQWLVFVLILILGMIPKPNIVIRFVDSVITFALILFIFINSFHLHINLFQWITT